MTAARVLVGGIGYRNLSDYSAGVLAVDVLAQRQWPEHVVVEDVSYGPIAVVQRLQDETADRTFGRLVSVSSVARGGGRIPGTITAYRWDGVLPSPDEVQGAVAEAVTGVISMDNTLIVCRQFGALPDETIVVEIEPLVQECGEELSAPIAAIFDSLCAMVTTLATDEAAVNLLPIAPLGGHMASAPVGAS
ncbi:MAG: hypothetical protein ABR543_06105 [Gemmatimonadaceae bacterium]